jgi:hypothetical protein
MADSGDENIASTSSFNSNSKKKHQYDVRFKLEALAYAEKHSGEKAAKQFGVDSRRIREWKKQKTDLLAMSDDDAKRARMSGTVPGRLVLITI